MRNEFKTAVRITFFFLVCFILVIPVHAQSEKITQDLEPAQKLLADGKYEDAYKAYLVFAEKENPLAQFTIGLFYRLGWGRPQNPGKACQWFEKAGRNQIPTAAHFFGDCLRQGTGMPKDPAAAIQWYEQAAGLGYHLSLLVMSQMIMDGIGVEQNTQKAIALCRQAADKQVVAAQIQMGHYLMDEKYNHQDLEQAFDWFSLAASKEAPEAQYYLGVMLKDGIGGPVDATAARYWFEKAAANGYEKAYIQTGTLYFNSPRDPATQKLAAADLAKSYMWLSAALRQEMIPEEKKRAAAMLEQVILVMPETWKPDLDVKIDHHFQTFPTTRQI